MTGPTTLAALTTLRLGGPAARYLEVDSEAAMIEAVRAADAAREPVLVLGGGSNVVVADEGFAGLVVRDVRSGVTVEGEDGCGGASLVSPAGTRWTDLVDRARRRGLDRHGGPGGHPRLGRRDPGAERRRLRAGGRRGPVEVRVWDRERSRVRTFAVGELGLGYRTSVLKRSLRSDDGPSRWAPTPRYVVLEVGFQLRLGTLSAPVGYAELAKRLGVGVGERAPMAQVRAAVLALRAGKGMVLDPEDHDTWSAGSFFTNPVLPAQLADQLPEGAPRYPVRSALPERTTGPSLGAVDPGLVKTSAAWLIEHAGFGKGFGLPGTVGVSTKHSLALTHRGGGTTAQLIGLARQVRDGVEAAFGVRLEPEPVLVGVSL